MCIELKTAWTGLQSAGPRGAHARSIPRPTGPQPLGQRQAVPYSGGEGHLRSVRDPGDDDGHPGRSGEIATSLAAVEKVLKQVE